MKHNNRTRSKEILTMHQLFYKFIRNNPTRTHRYSTLTITIDKKTHTVDVEDYKNNLYFENLPKTTLELFIGKWNDEAKLRQTILQNLESFKPFQL